MTDEVTIDEHELLDVSTKVEIVLSGIRYAIVFQDLDVLRKCIIDLKDCVETMEAVVEFDFGEDEELLTHE